MPHDHGEGLSHVLNRSISVVTGKGGTGKTSLTANIAGLAAEYGYHVLVVDTDPQGNLGRDLGYYGDPDIDDQGAGLLNAIQHGTPAAPVRGVRTNLDVIPGGTFVDDAVSIAGNLRARGRNPQLVLEEALRPVAGNYNLILIDSPPGDRYLQEIALNAVEYAVVPTRSDEASIDGLTRVAQAFGTARAINPSLELLGVVLFGIGASATVIQAEVRRKIADGLGDAAPVFDAQIRYLEAPAVESRNRGMLVHEYERDLVAKAPSFFDRAKGRHREEKVPRGERVAPTAHKLATDYATLTTEILTLMAAREAARTGSAAR